MVLRDPGAGAGRGRRRLGPRGRRARPRAAGGRRPRRGRGVGRRLVAALVEEARLHHPSVCLRVVENNTAARRCYAAAGLTRVSRQEEQEWNRGQPVAYVWMTA